MEPRLTCAPFLLLLLLFLLQGCHRLSAFNLDTDNVMRKDGDPDSLFGFSMVMHRQLEPEDKRMLLVGSPKAKSLRGQSSKITGGLYSCDMSSSSTNCNRVIFDDNEDKKRESKENQWMGVTVSSQGPGGKILTCAHRYQRRGNIGTSLESRDIIGRCYVLSQNLEIEYSSSSDGGGWHFCDGRARGHESFGSCQQGLSATFDKEYHYLIFGAPGAYNWKGIVRLEQRNDTLLEMGIFEDGPFEAGDEREKNADLVPAPANSYLGFSLDSGMSLTKKGQLTVVAGAPRANHSGAVVLLKKSDPPSNNLLAEFTLVGEGLASSFGYDLTVLDLNSDGWQDIVVGAPQYFEKDGEIGGAVYVFVNKKGNWNKVKPVRIDGPKDSMFGIAVENLGDLNLDGYQDFAVGAPYDDDEAGKVYIYGGSEKGLGSETAVQVLLGKALGVKLFGYSLAGNMDMDYNSYPDLAVGSLSDSVFMFKTRPVVNIEKEIKFTPKEIDLTKKNCPSGFCLDFEACLTYTANPPSYAPRLTVAYSLVADADHRQAGLSPRATFVDSGSYESRGTVTLNSKGKKQCFKRQLVIQENIKDKLRGIPIDVSVDIQGGSRKRRQSSGPLEPVMDAKEPKTVRSEVNFLKEGCGSDNKCQSKLQVTYRYGNKDKDTDPFVPMKEENGLPQILVRAQKDIVLEVKVTNLNGDDAHEAELVANFPRLMTFSGHRFPPDAPQQTTCRPNTNGSQLACELGNPFKGDAELTFYIILTTSGLSLNTTEVEIDLQLKTTSEQGKIPVVKAKAKVAIMLQLTLSGQIQPSQAYYSGKAKSLSDLKSESDLGSSITHQFKIINLAKRLPDLGSATLNIRWPKQTDKGDMLLYLMAINSTGVDKLDCTPKKEINNMDLLPSGNRRRRSTGSMSEEIGGVISRYEKKKSISLSCESGAQCVTIKCPLRGLDSNAVIIIQSRLSDSTLITHYSKFHHVEIPVKAYLHIDSTNKNTVLKTSDAQVKLTVFPEMSAAQSGASVPWWIILLSILFGLLLLGLLAFLLWKCFGKRNKEEPPEKETLTSNA